MTQPFADLRIAHRAEATEVPDESSFCAYSKSRVIVGPMAHVLATPGYAWPDHYFQRRASSQQANCKNGVLASRPEQLGTLLGN